MNESRYIEFADKKTLLIGFAVMIVFLIIRNNGLYPIVFADEFTYSKFSRLVPLADSALPNYIYFLVYRVTNVCGDGFLGCARIINTIFLFLAMPLLFAVSRKIAGSRFSSVFCAVIALGQVNTYTAYFMPECMYMLGFWACTLLMLSADKNTKLSTWGLIGTAWGVSALIKPHTLFLIPAVFFYSLYAGEFWVKGRVKIALFRALSVPISMVLAKLIIGYLLAGRSGLSLFGSFYAPYAGSALNKDSHYYMQLLQNSINSAFGHVLALCLLYAVPVALVFEFWFSLVSKRRADTTEYSRLVVYLTMIMVCLVGVTSIFTASIANVEPANHLHIRYYIFALPLLILLPIINCDIERALANRTARLIIALPIGCMVVYGTISKMMPYEVHSSTAPELYSVLKSGWLFYAIACTSLASLIAWALCGRAGSILYVFLLTPLLLGVVGYKMNESLRRSVVPDVYDRAAAFANAYLDKKDRQSVVVVGSSSAVGGLFRTLYHLDLPVTEFGIQTADDEYDLRKLPEGKNWVLVIGDHRLEGNRILTVPGNGFSLTKAR